MHDIISRPAAKEAGFTYYFTGVACPHGHVCRRFVSTYGCEICTDQHKKRYREDPEKYAKELAYKEKYRSENRDALNNYAKKYWRENPNAKVVKSRSRARNSEKISAYNAKYWEENKARLAARFSRYAKDNLVYFRAKGASRRAKQASGGRHTKEDIERILRDQSSLCVYCRVDISMKFHVDHIMPLKLGGSNDPSNLQCLCQTCNCRKSAKHPDAWAKEIGFVSEENQ